MTKQAIRMILFLPGLILGGFVTFILLIVAHPSSYEKDLIGSLLTIFSVFTFFFIIGSLPGIIMLLGYALWSLLSRPASERSSYFFYQVFALIVAIILLTLLTIYLFYGGAGISTILNYMADG